MREVEGLELRKIAIQNGLVSRALASCLEVVGSILYILLLFPSLLQLNRAFRRLKYIWPEWPNE